MLADLLQGQDVERVLRAAALWIAGDCSLLWPLRRSCGSTTPLASDLDAASEQLGRSLLKYSIRMAISISTLPSSVYRKNLIAAYSFRGPPQTPIRKYIGSSITSQNT